MDSGRSLNHQLLGFWLLALCLYARYGPFLGKQELSVPSLFLRTPEDLSRFVVELQQRELALKEKNNTITSR